MSRRSTVKASEYAETIDLILDQARDCLDRDKFLQLAASVAYDLRRHITRSRRNNEEPSDDEFLTIIGMH